MLVILKRNFCFVVNGRLETTWYVFLQTMFERFIPFAAKWIRTIETILRKKKLPGESAKRGNLIKHLIRDQWSCFTFQMTGSWRANSFLVLATNLARVAALRRYAIWTRTHSYASREVFISTWLVDLNELTYLNRNYWQNSQSEN